MHKRLTKFINCIYLLANTEHLTTCGGGDFPLRRPRDSAGVATDFSKIIFFRLNSFQEREKYFIMGLPLDSVRYSSWSMILYYYYYRTTL